MAKNCSVCDEPVIGDATVLCECGTPHRVCNPCEADVLAAEAGTAAFECDMCERKYGNTGNGKIELMA